VERDVSGSRGGEGLIVLLSFPISRKKRKLRPVSCFSARGIHVLILVSVVDRRARFGTPLFGQVVSSLPLL
jgi:hypothetical protein